MYYCLFGLLVVLVVLLLEMMSHPPVFMLCSGVPDKETENMLLLLPEVFPEGTGKKWLKMG